MLIRDFVSNELQQNPVAMFGEECWQSLLTVADVYEKEELECKASLEKIDWEFNIVPELVKKLRCKSCHSSLVFAPYEDDAYPIINLTCRSCDLDFCFDEELKVFGFTNFSSSWDRVTESDITESRWSP
mgnify:CR=1 FL=1